MSSTHTRGENLTNLTNLNGEHDQLIRSIRFWKEYGAFVALGGGLVLGAVWIIIFKLLGF